MKSLIISFLTYFLFIAPTFSQYYMSPGLLTINASGIHPRIQDHSVGAIGPNTRDREGRTINYYAISIQFENTSGTGCWRQIKFFKGEGTLVATSSLYSHDHTGRTKIIFDPNNGNVVYALYQERFSTGSYFQTFVKRFEYNPITNVITESNRFHVFDFQRGADFVIAPNGDLLVGSPMKNDGSVHIKSIRYSGGAFTHLNTFITSQPGETNTAPQGGGTWQLSLDMKGNTIAIAHTKGYFNNRSVKIKTGTYIAPTAPNTGALPLIHQYDFNNQSMYLPHSSRYQSLALRDNGDILYLMTESNNSNWKLVKIDPSDYSTSIVDNGSGNAQIVASENNMAYLFKKANSSEYTLKKFNDHDVHEYTYTPLAWQIDEGLTHLTVRDCKILSCGREANPQYTQHHQLYACSDCNGAEPTAQAECINQKHNVTVPSFYGPQSVPVYCTWNDVMIDASASTCENSVRMTIAEIDINTWVTSPNIFSGTICTNCTAAHDIRIGDYVAAPGPGYNFPSNYYLATIILGPGWHPVYMLFKFEICKEPKEPRLRTTSTNTNKSMFIYPNPTSGIVNITLDDIKTPSTIQVFNNLGQVIIEKEVKGQVTTEIDLAKYTNGIYMIQIITGDEKRIEKVVKQ